MRTVSDSVISLRVVDGFPAVAAVQPVRAAPWFPPGHGRGSGLMPDVKSIRVTAGCGRDAVVPVLYG
ncbi:hypothetical protein [Actinomadura nitritigenes]|uniref:hypothetical protein n=1 Tax=Actinomadura nitritigenes TaxID=134602 RepID=UPI003D89FE28